MRDEVEDSFNKMGMKKTDRRWSETFENRGRLYWKPSSLTDCSAWRQGGGGRGGEGGGGEEEGKEEDDRVEWGRGEVLK